MLCQFHVLKAVGRYTNSEAPQAAASLLQKCMEGQTECHLLQLPTNEYGSADQGQDPISCITHCRYRSIT